MFSTFSQSTCCAGNPYPFTIPARLTKWLKPCLLTYPKRPRTVIRFTPILFNFPRRAHQSNLCQTLNLARCARSRAFVAPAYARFHARWRTDSFDFIVAICFSNKPGRYCITVRFESNLRNASVMTFTTSITRQAPHSKALAKCNITIPLRTISNSYRLRETRSSALLVQVKSTKNAVEVSLRPLGSTTYAELYLYNNLQNEWTTSGSVESMPSLTVEYFYVCNV